MEAREGGEIVEQYLVRLPFVKTQTDREMLHESDLPKGYGLAWRDPSLRAAYFAPMPLNWVLGIWLNLYYRVLWGPRAWPAAAFDKAVGDAYRKVGAMEVEAERRGNWKGHREHAEELERALMAYREDGRCKYGTGVGDERIPVKEE